MKPVNLKSVKPHARNANKGSERGAAQIEESLKDYGAGRSILVDKNNITIAGNHVLQAAAELGLKAIEVETDGSTLVIVRRKDLDLSDDKDKRAVELAIADNRTRDVSVNKYDREIIEEELRAGANLSKFFLDDELEEMLQKQDAADKKAAEAEYKVKVNLNFTADQYVQFTAYTKGHGATLEVVLLEMLRQAIDYKALRDKAVKTSLDSIGYKA